MLPIRSPSRCSCRLLSEGRRERYLTARCIGRSCSPLPVSLAPDPREQLGQVDCERRRTGVGMPDELIPHHVGCLVAGTPALDVTRFTVHHPVLGDALLQVQPTFLEPVGPLARVRYDL